MNEELRDEYGRLKWDYLFMGLAFWYRERSIDPDTKHGAVYVKDNIPISYGYNGPIRGFDDSKLKLTRPEKYSFLSHAEMAGIKNAALAGSLGLKGSTVYVTGRPCSNCLRDMLDVGVVEIVYGPQESVMINYEDIARSEYYLEHLNREVVFRKINFNPLEFYRG